MTTAEQPFQFLVLRDREIEELRAENERLKALLREAANEIDELGFPSVADALLRQLEVKP